MRKKIYKDEFYPFYDFTDISSSVVKEIELTEFQYEYYNSIMDDFYEVQDKLKELFMEG